MLVLSRKRDEQLHIQTKNGDVIKIHISHIKGQQVRITLDAPHSCSIMREELFSMSQEALD